MTSPREPPRAQGLGLRLVLLAPSSATAAARHAVVDEGGRILAEGGLSTCERALLAELEQRYGRARLRLALPTLGGLQLASDVHWRSGWRVQRSSLTGRHRLLDPFDVRRAHGSREACLVALEQARQAGDVAPAAEHVVLLLHGLGRTRRSLRPLARHLAALGLTPARLAFATTRAPLARHVEDLREVLAGLEARRVSFVTHSLGAIVLRAALAREAERDVPLELGRAVLLAPPSRGSLLARRLSPRWPFRALLGRTGAELSAGALEDLPPPPCPFAIVAAARGRPEGWNPLLPGDDDGILTVAETRLPGASDHLVVRGVHTTLMGDPRVVEATGRFLLEGRLRAGPRVTDPGWGPPVPPGAALAPASYSCV